MPSPSTGANKFFTIVILMNSVDLTFIDFPNQVLRFESVISPTVGKEKGYNFIIILTAYIIRASRNLSYILQIPPCSASLGQVWCFAFSLLKFSCFALIVVILPAFRWRTLLSPHPPPLVHDAATLNSRRYVQKCTHWRKWQKWQLIAKIAKV